MKRIVSTEIKDPKKRVCELLKRISAQLSDGYWEDTKIYYEFWNWLDFFVENDMLYIRVNEEPCHEDAESFLPQYTDDKILDYVAEVIEFCTENLPTELFCTFDQWIDIIDIVIKIFRLEAEKMRVMYAPIKPVKIVMEGPEKSCQDFDECLKILEHKLLNEPPVLMSDVSFPKSDAEVQTNNDASVGKLFLGKPRDPDRIDKFLNILSNYWKRVPDWRLGQLLSNLNIKKDWFYIEDAELEQALIDFFEHMKG